jgi:hypothetical protein
LARNEGKQLSRRDEGATARRDPPKLIGAAEVDARENLAIPFGAKPDPRNAVFGRDLRKTMLEFGLLRFGDMQGAVDRRRQGNKG